MTTIVRRIPSEGTAVILTPEGQEALTSDSPYEAGPGFVSLKPRRQMSALFVCQIALARILQAVQFYGLDAKSFLGSGGTVEHTKPFRLHRIFIDWPTSEDLIDPKPSCLIRAVGPRKYSGQALDNPVEEDTIDRFEKDTVLKKSASFSCTLQVEMLTTHKEARRGIEAGMEQVLLNEPFDTRPGRRILMKEYYDRMVRLTVGEAQYEDSPQTAISNEWVVVTRVTAEVDVVLLAPVLRTKIPRFATESGQDTDLTDAVPPRDTV